MGIALQQIRSTRVRSAQARGAAARLVSTAAAALLVLVAAGCGDEQPSTESTQDESGVVVYFVEDGALKPVVQESSAKVAAMNPQGRAALAVKTLFQDEPDGDDGHATFWGRGCVSGAAVKSLTNNAGQIVLTLGGAGGQVCAKSGAEDTLQQQQLAWTLVKNFEADPTTPIKVIGQNGAAIWDGLVADEGVLAG